MYENTGSKIATHGPRPVFPDDVRRQCAIGVGSRTLVCFFSQGVAVASQHAIAASPSGCVWTDVATNGTRYALEALQRLSIPTYGCTSFLRQHEHICMIDRPAACQAPPYRAPTRKAPETPQGAFAAISSLTSPPLLESMSCRIGHVVISAARFPVADHHPPTFMRCHARPVLVRRDEGGVGCDHE